MSIVENVEPRIQNVKVTADAIHRIPGGRSRVERAVSVVLAFIGSDGQTTGTF